LKAALINKMLPEESNKFSRQIKFVAQTMESISLEDLKEFLKSNKFELQPTQTRLCFPIIKRIYNKMAIGVEFENINVDDLLLINGHHRYICSLLLQKTVGKNLWKSPSQITTYQWAEIDIDSKDWESIEIIRRHNFKDALRNSMDIRLFEGLA
jgi:hypothetical protein